MSVGLLVRSKAGRILRITSPEGPMLKVCVSFSGPIGEFQKTKDP